MQRQKKDIYIFIFFEKLIILIIKCICDGYVFFVDFNLYFEMYMITYMYLF